MIKHFRSKTAQAIFDGEQSRLSRRIPLALHPKVRRLLDQLNAATKIETLTKPPSNRLEKLGGDLKGFWSLRINRQWRVIFRWEAGVATDVDVVDYH